MMLLHSEHCLLTWTETNMLRSNAISPSTNLYHRLTNMGRDRVSMKWREWNQIKGSDSRQDWNENTILGDTVALSLNKISNISSLIAGEWKRKQSRVKMSMGLYACLCGRTFAMNAVILSCRKHCFFTRNHYGTFAPNALSMNENKNRNGLHMYFNKNERVDTCVDWRELFVGEIEATTSITVVNGKENQWRTCFVWHTKKLWWIRVGWTPRRNTNAEIEWILNQSVSIIATDCSRSILAFSNK